MTLISRRKALCLAIIAAACLVLLLLLWPANSRPHTADLRIAGQPQMSNGAMLVSIVLSNGTSSTLNIVDDGAGHPFVIVEADPGTNPPGTVGFELNYPANTLKLNLAPGAALTNSLRVINAPSRFRFNIMVRDLADERHRAPEQLLSYWMSKIAGRQSTYQGPDLRALSPWIETGATSNMAQKAAEQAR